MNHVLMLLDNSGSMASIREEAVRHFNEQAQTVRRKARETSIPVDISLVCFNEKADVVHWRVPVESLPDLELARYHPNGSTALNDALAKHCLKLEAENPTTDDFLVCVVSDGEENASVEYPRNRPEMVRNLVERLQNTKRWTFLHLGARQEIGQLVKDYGYKAGNVAAFAPDAKGMLRAQSLSCQATDRYYENLAHGRAQDKLFEEEQADPT